MAVFSFRTGNKDLDQVKANESLRYVGGNVLKEAKFKVE